MWIGKEGWRDEQILNMHSYYFKFLNLVMKVFKVAHIASDVKISLRVGEYCFRKTIARREF